MILMVEDHAWERNKPKTKVSMFANFEVGCSIKRREEDKKNRQFSNFLYVIVTVYFTYFVSIKTLKGHVMCLKRLITVPFERSEVFHLLRLGVSVPSLHIESTNSMIM